MKTNSIKSLILIAALIFAILSLSSCDVLLSFIAPVECAHESVTKGDCKTPAICNICKQKVGGYGSHNYEPSVNAPSCTSDGYTSYVCKICSDSYRGAQTPALGHELGEWTVTKQPTSTSNGQKERVCSRCGYTERDTVFAHTHELLSVTAKEPTCTEDGWDSYEYCAHCEYSTKTVVKALGHDYGAYISVGDGTHSRVCKNDPSHVISEPCSGGSVSGSGLPICEFCKTEYEFAVRPGNSSYGYYALGNYANGSDLQELYKALTNTAENFFTSSENVTPEDGYYVIGTFDLGDYGLSDDEGMAVWKVFYVSNPAYYWLDASIVTRGDEMLLTISDIYSTASYRRLCDAAIETMTDACNSLVKSGMTDLEKAVTITEYIVKNMEYAYESDGVTPVDEMWAHNMTGLAMHGLGVCESYAKSFMYLCLLNKVECIMGSGYAGGEAHAWNYVKLDGEWYGADITWTDNSGDKAVFDTFGLSEASIFADHTPHSSETLCVQFIYKAPELASSNIELTALYKNGEYVGLYKSVDEAFSAMTDKDGEYEIRINYYSSYAGAIEHTIRSSSTPDVKKLSFIGTSEYVGAGYLDNNTHLYISSDLTLNSDLELSGIYVQCSGKGKTFKLNVGSHMVTTSGGSVMIDARVVSKENSTLTVSTERGTYFFAGADLYRLVVNSDKVVFGADSTIKYCKRNNIYVQNGAKVEIENET